MVEMSRGLHVAAICLMFKDRSIAFPLHFCYKPQGQVAVAECELESSYSSKTKRSFDTVLCHGRVLSYMLQATGRTSPSTGEPRVPHVGPEGELLVHVQA